MNIELDNELVARIKQAAQKEACERIVKQIMSNFNMVELKAEIKKEIVKNAVQLLSTHIENVYQTSSVIERSLQSAEARVNKKIADTIANGIMIKFKD